MKDIPEFHGNPNDLDWNPEYVFKLKLDLEQANFFLLDMEKGKYGRDYYANKVMKMEIEKLATDEGLEKANNDIQVLATELKDIADYLDINKKTSIGSTSIFHREARELANKYKDK